MTTSGSIVGQANNQQYNQAGNQTSNQQAVQPVAPDTSDVDQVQVLVSAHLNLLGERLKEISRNIQSYLEKGQSPNIDRSLDIILDTVIYSSTALLNLFEAVKEIKNLKNNPKTEEQIDQELTKLAIYHLSTATIQPAQQTRPVQSSQQQIVQVKTERN